MEYIFNPKGDEPNINEGMIFKDIKFLCETEELHRLLEVDLQKVGRLLNVDKVEAQKITTSVIESIWRMNIKKHLKPNKYETITQ